MPAPPRIRYWIAAIILLLAVVVTGTVVIISKYRPGEPLRIDLATPAPIRGDIYVSGAVSNPGIYPLQEGDTISGLIESAGGLAADAANARLNISVERPEMAPQKIDINRAEVWLLESLPGIGESRAQSIVDYRDQNGPFRLTSDLLKVNGISEAVYQKISSLITVGD